MGILAFAAISGSVWKWIHRLGGPGLIVIGIVDNTPFISAPPGSALSSVILLSAHRPAWWGYYAIMATVGEVLGGFVTYRLAEKGGRAVLERKMGNSRLEKIYRRFEKRGFMTVFTGSLLPLPFPFTPVLMAAGVMQYPRKKFLSALAAGRAGRCFTVAFLARSCGQQMIGFLSRRDRPLMYLLISMAVTAGIGALAFFKWHRPKTRH